MAKLLIVEDDQELAVMMSEWLCREGHVADVVYDGESALTNLKVSPYDAVLLDWGLPTMSGIELLGKLRRDKHDVLTLMLTGKTETGDKIVGLDAGADDYLTKPFVLEELSARINALMRRSRVYVASEIKHGKLQIDSKAHSVRVAGKPVELQRMEFALLEFFMRNPNQVFSPEALMDRVWSAYAEASPDTVRTCIKNIRKKIGTSAEIKNVFGVGYKLETR